MSENRGMSDAPPAGPTIAAPSGERRTEGAVADPATHRRWEPWAAFALVALAFAPAVVGMVTTWWVDPDYGHGFLMPIVAAWLLRSRRDRLERLRPASSWTAVPLIALCLLALVISQLGFLISLGPYAFVGALAGVVLAFWGWRGLGAVLPALIALLLACPLPGLVEDAITLPLKRVSAQLATGLLNVSSIPAFLDGNMIHLEGADRLWVADACSGIRSLISLLSLAIVACLVWRRHWSLKLAVVLACVPIAVLVNGLRIWLTGVLSARVGPEAAAGAFHFFEGFVALRRGGPPAARLRRPPERPLPPRSDA